MALGVGSRPKRSAGERRTVAAALRTAGRVTLWAVLGLLLVRGAGSVLAGPPKGEPTATPTGLSDPATSAFAVRFARAYLSGASSQELAPLLAPGTRVPPRGASVPGVEVEQAEVAGSEAVGDGQAIVTVACELADARTLYLAVPIVREGAGGVAAPGAPAVVAGPAGVGEESRSSPTSRRPGRRRHRRAGAALPARLLLGVRAGRSLLPAGAGSRGRAPRQRPAACGRLRRQADRRGRRRSAHGARHRAGRDPLSGAIFPLAYRLEVARHGRWYVERVEGALS